MGNLPDEATWLVGFRVVSEPKGSLQPSESLPVPAEHSDFYPEDVDLNRPPLAPPNNHNETEHSRNINSSLSARAVDTTAANVAPVFWGPKLYVKIKGRPGDEQSFGRESQH